MIKFSLECSKFATNPGSPVRIVYSPKFDELGRLLYVEESGAENVQDFINSFRESADVSCIIRRFEATADPTLLQKRTGIFVDCTKMPQTLAQALQLKIDSDRLFDSLPVDIKEKFNNDKNQFFAQAGNKDWCVTMNDFLPESMRVPNNTDVKEDTKVES